MFDYLQKLLDAKGLAPHGFCLLWDPSLIWTHVVSDALIGAAYFSIPVAMAYFLTKRPDIAFRWVAWLFAAFIMACGTTHFLSIWVLWHPDYGPEALVKAATAAVSVVTAIALWPLLPRLIALPSPAQLAAANTGLQLRVAERDTALAALERETAERLRAEEKLRQAAKMEAIGQLTGGIAHDFNNLMQIIVANLDRVQRTVGDDDRLARPVANALTGATRAARLTDQLLAFARRQPMIVERQDLNAVVRSTAELFGGTGRSRVELATDLAGDLWPVDIDADQAGSALLNLMVNARDAMPDGGRITVATRNRTLTDCDDAADWVELQVTDTGLGMDQDTVARAFEPFFTTKGVGDGTGLGLSQVYGFTSQSGGAISIDSAPGRGTTITIRLPRAR